MPAIKLRYCTRRANRSGAERWYWQRAGHPLIRLPDDLAERVTMVLRLNGDADRTATVEPSRGTIQWVVRKYQASDDYTRLAANSLKIYKRFLRDIEQLGPHLPFSSFTRRAVIDFVQSYLKPSQRRTAGTCLKNLFRLANYLGLVAVDETANLRLRTGPPRARVWTDDEKARWLATATPAYMITAFRLLEFTAQRPSDVLKATWPQYSGSAIRLRQQKTAALLDVPIHPTLREHLDALNRSSLVIVASRGRPVSYLAFNRHFRAISRRAGIDAQARDLRRTAMIRMAEAGATVPQIASVSGHSIDRCSRILETYLPRGRSLAEAAIAKLAEYRRETKV